MYVPNHACIPNFDLKLKNDSRSVENENIIYEYTAVAIKDSI